MSASLRIVGSIRDSTNYRSLQSATCGQLYCTLQQPFNDSSVSLVKYKAWDESGHRKWTTIFRNVSRYKVNKKHANVTYKLLHFALNTRSVLHHINPTTHSDKSCLWCHNEPETLKHIFLKCPQFKRVRSAARSVRRALLPDTKTRTLDIILNDNRCKLLGDLQHAYTNAIWRTRNKLLFGADNICPLTAFKTTLTTHLGARLLAFPQEAPTLNSRVALAKQAFV